MIRPLPSRMARISDVQVSSSASISGSVPAKSARPNGTAAGELRQQRFGRMFGTYSAVSFGVWVDAGGPQTVRVELPPAGTPRSARRDLGALQQRGLRAVVGELDPPLLRGLVLDGELRRLGEQQVG